MSEGFPTGQVATTTEHAMQLSESGHYPCRNQACNYFFDPHTSLIDQEGNADCPSCQKSYNMYHVNPFSRHDQSDVRDDYGHSRHQVQLPLGGMHTYSVGGGTIAGLSLDEQGKLGEDVVEKLGEIPGYGPIDGRHTTYQSAADLYCGEWAVEVKTANFDGKHQRFWPGSPAEKTSRNERAAAAGYKGLLGVLVVFNFRDSEADIYVHEMPFSGVKVNGQMKHGLFSYRSHSPGATQIAARIPFDNPLLKPIIEKIEPHQEMPF